jgi:hypothetical protein
MGVTELQVMKATREKRPKWLEEYDTGKTANCSYEGTGSHSCAKPLTNADEQHPCEGQLAGLMQVRLVLATH